MNWLRSQSNVMLFAVTGFLAGISLAQTNPLSYRPVAAEFSAALDRIVLVSGNPNVLHIYNPVSQNDIKVNLVQPPLCLSISPDGRYAAVGHDALISYVNLTTGAVEKQFVVPAKVQSITLSGAWIYVMPSYYGGSVSINIGTGVVTPNTAVFYGSGGRFNATVNAIYGTRDGISPNDIEEYTISTGPITRQFDSPYHGDYCIFGPIWFSPDGTRIYTGCGTVFHASQDPNLDMYYLSSLTGVASIGSLTESASIRTLALIPGQAVYPSTTLNDDKVMLFESVYLQFLGQFSLPNFVVGSNTFKAHGKWVFFNSAATELDVLMEADQTSGLLNDFAVLRVALGPGPSCGATFSSSSASVAAAGSQGTVNITAPPGCIYQATSGADWLEIISGVYGSGNSTLTYVALPNTDSSPRLANLTMGGQAFTVRQDGADASSGPLALLGYNVVDSAYDKPLDRIILVAANPHMLHIYDPAGKTDQAVPLVSAPLSVSVRPDGLYAAVGQDGWVSYVNLQTGTVEKVIQVITDVGHILLAGNGYAYLFPSRDWSDIYSLQISTGLSTATSAIYDGRVPRLYTNGKYMYLGGNWSSKWDISQGVAKNLNSFTSGFNTCGNLWLTEDGRRVFTACGKAYTTSEVPQQDLQYNGTLSATSSVTWAEEATQQQSTAVIPGANNGSSFGTRQPDDTQVQIYGDAFLGYMGAIPVPQFTVAGKSFLGHGKFVFWNKSETTLYVIEQADSAAGLLAGWGVTALSPSSARQVTMDSITNAANQAPGRIAAGEIVTIKGSGLGLANPISFSVNPVTGKVDTQLAGTQVFFSGYAAPILYASDNQVNAIVPYEVGFQSQVDVQVVYQNVLSATTTVTVASASPAIFTMDGTGNGQAVAVNLDGSVADAAHAAQAGSTVIIYFTGGGTTNPPGVTGSVTGSVLKRLTQTSAATIGGRPATVTFAGAAPACVDGVGVLIVRLADDTPAGPAQPVIITVGVNSSPGTATIAVR
jgi:uncharacterized protein (TIGR03437 family)